MSWYVNFELFPFFSCKVTFLNGWFFVIFLVEKNNPSV